MQDYIYANHKCRIILNLVGPFCAVIGLDRFKTTEKGGFGIFPLYGFRVRVRFRVRVNITNKFRDRFTVRDF